MLTYGLNRHRPLLLVAGVATLIAAIWRLGLHLSNSDTANSLVSPGVTSGSQYWLGLGLHLVSCVLLAAGLTRLAARSYSARTVLILASFTWIISQGILITHVERYGLVSIFDIALEVVRLSNYPLLILTLLWLAGVGSVKRPMTDPHDEYLLRERAAGGFSGYAFTIAVLLAAVIASLAYDSGMRMLWSGGTSDWWWPVSLLSTLAGAGFGIAGWVLLLAKKRIGGLAIAGFSLSMAALHLIEFAMIVRFAQRYGADYFSYATWPPFGIAPSIASLIDLSGVTLLGVVWGLRYFRAPPRSDAGSAFEPTLLATPTALNVVNHGTFPTSSGATETST